MFIQISLNVVVYTLLFKPIVSYTCSIHIKYNININKLLHMNVSNNSYFILYGNNSVYSSNVLLNN